MRLGFLGVTLGLVSVVAVACGGNALGSGDEGDAEPTTPFDNDGAPLVEGYVSHCDELEVAVKHYAVCTEQPAPASFFDYIREQCERDTAATPARCTSAFRDLTRCQARGLESCDRGRSCESLELAYADCASDGACHILGGGIRDVLTDGLDVITDHFACQCREDDAPASDGIPCNSPTECSRVCCACPASSLGYSAQVCDKSATGGAGPGVCATDEAACAATSFRCEEMK
jgi:hypothetical protein